MTDDELKALFEAHTAATQRQLEKSAEETRSQIAEIRHHVDQTAVGMRQHVDQTAAETRRHFDVTSGGLRHEIQLVAEKVLGVDEKLDRTAADIRDEMRRGFSETQAMIKFSHAELDRRVRTLENGHRSLEETVADLQARVDRLETSTH